MEGRKEKHNNNIITIMGGLEDCKRSWEALKDKIKSYIILYYNVYFIKLQVINKTECCCYEKKIQPEKMLNQSQHTGTYEYCCIFIAM